MFALGLLAVFLVFGGLMRHTCADALLLGAAWAALLPRFALSWLAFTPDSAKLLLGAMCLGGLLTVAAMSVQRPALSLPQSVPRGLAQCAAAMAVAAAVFGSFFGFDRDSVAAAAGYVSGTDCAPLYVSGQLEAALALAWLVVLAGAAAACGVPWSPGACCARRRPALTALLLLAALLVGMARHMPELAGDSAAHQAARAFAWLPVAACFGLGAHALAAHLGKRLASLAGESAMAPLRRLGVAYCVAALAIAGLTGAAKLANPTRDLGEQRALLGIAEPIVVAFSPADEGRYGLSGFGPLQRTPVQGEPYRWSIDPAPSLWVELARPYDRTAVLKIHPAPCSRCRHRSMDVELNGVTVARLRLSDGFHEYSVPLPRDFQKAGPNLIAFRFDFGARQPSPAGGAGGFDRLAAAFASLVIEPQRRLS